MFDPTALASAGIRELAPYEPGKPITTLAREYGVSDIVKLASNENPRGPSPRAVAAAQSTLEGIHRYPDGAGTALRERIAVQFSVEPAAVTLGNGSNDVLDMLARAFLGPGRNAVFSRHAFAVYPIATRAAGADARIAEPLPANHPTAPYGHDLDAMLAAIDADTRLVFIANPNNPTGTWVSGQAVHDFLRAVPEHVVVVLDEAYAECVDGVEGYVEAAGWLPDMPHLVVTRSFSKIHGLPGLRCGYGLSSPAIADLLNRARQPFNVNSAALAAAEAALDDAAFLDQSRRINTAGRQQLTAGFERLGLAYIPSIANFVAVDVGRDAAAVYEALLRRGIIVRPIGGYELPQHLRITVGTEQQNARCLEALAEVLAG